MEPLYEITADLIRLNEILDECEGDLTKAGPEIEIYFAEIEGKEAQKLDNYVGLVKTLEMESIAARAEAEQYLAKAAARTRKAEYLLATLHGHMKATQRTKIRTAAGRVLSVVGNGGLLPVAIDEDIVPASLPERFQEISVDKGAIREALQNGEKLPFARLLPRGTHLRIS